MQAEIKIIFPVLVLFLVHPYWWCHVFFSHYLCDTRLTSALCILSVIPGLPQHCLLDNQASFAVDDPIEIQKTSQKPTGNCTSTEPEWSITVTNQGQANEPPTSQNLTKTMESKHETIQQQVSESNRAISRHQSNQEKQREAQAHNHQGIEESNNEDEENPPGDFNNESSTNKGLEGNLLFRQTSNHKRSGRAFRLSQESTNEGSLYLVPTLIKVRIMDLIVIYNKPLNSSPSRTRISKKQTVISH